MGACGGKSKEKVKKNEEPSSNIIGQPSNNLNDPEIKKSDISGEKTTTSATTGLQSNTQQNSNEVKDNFKNQEPSQQVGIQILPFDDNQKATTNSADIGSIQGMVQYLPGHIGKGNDNKITNNPFKNNNQGILGNDPISQQQQNLQMNHLNQSNQNQESDSKIFANQIQAIDSNNFSAMIPSSIQKDRQLGLRYADKGDQLNSVCNVPGIQQIESKFT